MEWVVAGGVTQAMRQRAHGEDVGSASDVEHHHVPTVTAHAATRYSAHLRHVHQLRLRQHHVTGNIDRASIEDVHWRRDQC